MHLTVRPFAAEDIAGYVAYFTQMPPAESERMGVAVDRLPPPEQMHADLAASLTEPIDRVRSFMLAWCVDGAVIGHSSLKDIVTRRERPHAFAHVAVRPARERLWSAPLLPCRARFLRALRRSKHHLRAKGRQSEAEPDAAKNRISPAQELRRRIVRAQAWSAS